MTWSLVVLGVMLLALAGISTVLRLRSPRQVAQVLRIDRPDGYIEVTGNISSAQARAIAERWLGLLDGEPDVGP